MKKTTAGNGIEGFHLLVGTYFIAYSVGVALRLFVPELNSGEVHIGGFWWLVFYNILTCMIWSVATKLICKHPMVYIPYMMLIGCCQGVSLVAIWSRIVGAPVTMCSSGAVAGSLIGAATVFHRLKSYIRSIASFDPYTGMISGMIYGTVAGWIIIPLLFSDNIPVGTGNPAPLCFCVVVIFGIPVYFIISYIIKNCIDWYLMRFEEERQQVMKDQDLFDEKCARSRAEKEARAKEEAERTRREQERAREEREKRYYRQENNKGSSRSYSYGGGSSAGRKSAGSRNNTVNTYFKGCTSKAELKRRYRQLCKKLHPDCPGGSAESFRRMKSEYEALFSKMAG